jgi:hypothetical protein
MNQQKSIPIPPRLKNVKSDFEDWRATKKKGSRIPQGLWEDVVRLYPEFTVSKIATTLSLSYTDLKQRVENKVVTDSSNHNKPVPAFFELNSTAPSTSVSECVVEMEDGSGSKMRMCFRGKTDFDLLELGKSFWMRRL